MNGAFRLKNVDLTRINLIEATKDTRRMYLSNYSVPLHVGRSECSVLA